MSIAAADLAARLAGLEGIGETETGIVRLAWTPEDAACRAWFAEQAAELGRGCQTDPAGNLWALPDGDGPWWGAGSHLDSVRGGGRYDGPLGVAAAFAVAARASAPVAVVCLADEEGARYNTPTFGSRALVGRLDAQDALSRRDDRGIELREAMRAAGVDPDGLVRAPEWLERLRGFLELHIDQTRDLAAASRPAGVVAGLASRLRLQVDVHGRADHAGTTRRGERRDAMSAAARLIVAAEDLARNIVQTTSASEVGPDETRVTSASEVGPDETRVTSASEVAPDETRVASASEVGPDETRVASAGEVGPGEIVVTAARVVVEPNALTTIAGHVRLWLDARAPEPGAIDAWHAGLEARAAEIAAATRTEIGLRTASRSAGTPFAPEVRRALAAALGEPDGPQLLSFAGHDAGVLAERIPAGMVFVRNATGVSHSPDEHVDLADAAHGATAMLRALEELA